VKVHAQRLILDRVPSDAHTQPQPAAGEDVDLCRLFGDERRLALGEDENAGDEFGRRCRQVTEGTNGSWNISGCVGAINGRLVVAAPLGRR
jgi:hypothetical protein